MIGSFCRALQRRIVLFSLGVVCIVLAGCSQTFRQIAIPLPTATGDPAPLNRALFAAQDSPRPGTVTFVDVPGDSNVGVVQVGVNPVQIGLTFGGARAVIPNAGDNTVSSFQTGITTATVTATSLPVSANPVFAHSRQIGKFYVALAGIGALGVVDSTLSLVKQVPLTSCTPVAISQVPNGGNVYVGCSNGSVSVVTPSDNIEVTNFPVGTSISWMDTSPDGKYTFVADKGGSQVEVICSTSDVSVCVGNSVIATPGLPAAPSFLKYDVHSQRVYVAGAGFVTILDASGVTPSFTALVPPSPLTFSGNTWVTALQDGTRFYVSDDAAQTVTVFSASSLSLIKTIKLNDATTPGLRPSNTTPIMIDSDKNSTKVYTANTGSNDFSIIRTSDDTEVFPFSNGDPTLPGRIGAPLIEVACTPSLPLTTCRQTPTYVQVLP